MRGYREERLTVVTYVVILVARCATDGIPRLSMTVNTVTFRFNLRDNSVSRQAGLPVRHTFIKTQRMLNRLGAYAPGDITI